MKKILFTLVLLLILSPERSEGQQQNGTPNQIRVLTDANSYLLISGLGQTLPINQPQVFSNTRLKTDANGYLLVVLTGGTITAPLEIDNNGIAVTSTDGIVIANNTAATAGIPVQQSPRLRFRSHVWNTTATAADNTNDWFIESVPVSGTTPAGLLKFGSSLNGAGTTFPFTFSSSGNFTTSSINSSAVITNTGPITVTAGAGDNKNLFLTGTINSTSPAGVYYNTTMTGITTSAQGIDFLPSFSLGADSSSVSTALFEQPAITLNGHTLTNATTLDVNDAPTNGTNKRALWVHGGISQLDGGVRSLEYRLSTVGGTTGSLAISNTAPTIASGGCTSPAVTWSNGTAAFKLTIGTSCTGVKTVTLTLPAATNGWACDVTDNTTPASFRLTAQSTNTTAVIISNWAATTGLTIDFVAGEVLFVKCLGG